MRCARLSIFGIIISLISFNLYAFATGEFKRVDLRNISVDYQDGQGLITVKQLDATLGNFEVSLEDYQVDIKKENNKVLFTKENTSLFISNIQGSVLDSVTSLSLDNASLLFEPKVALKLRLDAAEFEMGDGVQKIRKLSLECKSDRGRNGDVLSFIRPCFDLGRLSIPVLNISEFSKGTVGSIFPINEITQKNHTEQVKKIKGPNVLTDISLIVYKNNYTLTLRTKFIVKLKLKVKGTAHYQPEQNRVIFSVKKAKVGWLSVKKSFMKEVREAGIKNVQVSGYNIIINL